MPVTIDSSPLREAVRDHFAKVADDAAQDMLGDMERDAPRDTGAMTQTIEIEEHDTETSITRLIRAPVEYASYQDQGVEGPILPVRAKALRFTAKDGTVVIVASTKGVPATHWWSEKIAKWSDYVARAMGA